MSKFSWLHIDDYFSAKTRTEPCLNTYVVSFPLVRWSWQWISCHFSLSRVFSFPNWILMNFDCIHSFSPVKTRVKPLPHRSTFTDFHSDINTSHWNTVVDLIQKFFFSINQCLSAAVVLFPLPLRKFRATKHHAIYFSWYLSSLSVYLVYPLEFNLIFI